LFRSKEYLGRRITFFDVSHTISPRFPCCGTLWFAEHYGLRNTMVCGTLFSGGLRFSPQFPFSHVIALKFSSYMKCLIFARFLLLWTYCIPVYTVLYTEAYDENSSSYRTAPSRGEILRPPENSVPQTIVFRNKEIGDKLCGKHRKKNYVAI
jgi:hypothetical protein